MKPIFAESNESFETGAKRGSQAGKCRPDLTSPFAAERKGWINTHGAVNYGDRNWEKGMPFSRVLASMERHLMSFKQGDVSEDHLAQLGWNVDAMLHFEEAVKLGILPGSLNDLPRYKQQASKDRNAEMINRLNLGEFDTRNVPQNSTLPQDVYTLYVPVQPENYGGTDTDPLDIHETTGDYEYDEARKLAQGNDNCRDGRSRYEQENGMKLGEGWRELMFHSLLRLECPRHVAKQISGGTAFTVVAPNEYQRFVYIAGPMRDYKDFNFPAFDRARDVFFADGWHVISPADIDRVAGDSSEAKTLPPQYVYAFRDFFSLYYIARESNGLGAIAMLQGWEKSTGAVAEFFIARWLGLRILDAVNGEPLDFNTVNGPQIVASINRFLLGQIAK